MATSTNSMTSKHSNAGTVVWKRFGAFLIDLFLLQFFVVQPLAFKIQRLIPAETSFRDISLYLQQQPELSKELNMLFLLLFGLIFAYFVVLEWSIGQTLGKKILNIRVVATGPFLSQQKPQGKITLLQAIVRNIPLLPVFPLIFLWVVDPLFLMIKKDRLTDRYVHTTVVLCTPKQKV